MRNSNIMSADILPRLRQEAEKVPAPAETKPPVVAATTQEKSWFQGNMILIIAFSSIIVALIAIVAYLLSNKQQQPPTAAKPPLLPRPKPKTSSHSEVVASASDDELAKYGGQKTAEPAATKESPKEPDTVPPVTVKAPEPPKEDASTTIKKLVADEAKNLETKDFAPVEQLNETGDIAVIKKFTTNTDLTTLGFDYAAVVQCCNGKQPLHKGFRWRFAS